MDYEALRKSVAEDAAFRRRQRLQPVGGQGDKIFPPTYPGEGRNAPARHVLERRRIAGEDVWCALVDSVQSQANRLEEALLAVIRDSGVVVPYVTVDFRGQGLAGIEEVTSLDAPHRVYDAILRDSLLDKVPFPKSDMGVRLAEAKPASATALLEISPTALLFGAWNSTGEGGGLGAKFPRALVSEIAAIGVTVEETEKIEKSRDEIKISLLAANAGRRTGSRIDPLGVLRKVEVYQGDGKAWDVDAAKLGKRAKKVRPSEINHGNIAPSVQALGITCDYAEQIAVISFAGLRRLGFGGGERDATGRAYLAALGLLALAEQDARGYALRSRCDLVCEGRAPLERVLPGGDVVAMELDRAGAHALYKAAFDAAKGAGFELHEDPVRLVPQDKLVTIVRESQRLALEGEGGEPEDPPGA
jgi:CRISPR-associated protein Csb1